MSPEQNGNGSVPEADWRTGWTKLEGFSDRLKWSVEMCEEYADPFQVGKALKDLGLTKTETFLYRYIDREDVGARPDQKVLDTLGVLLDVDPTWLDKGTGSPLNGARDREASLSKIRTRLAAANLGKGEKLAALRDLIRTQGGPRTFGERLLVSIDAHPVYTTPSALKSALQTLGVPGAGSVYFYVYGDSEPRHPKKFCAYAGRLLGKEPDWLRTGDGPEDLEISVTAEILQKEQAEGKELEPAPRVEARVSPRQSGGRTRRIAKDDQVDASEVEATLSLFNVHETVLKTDEWLARVDHDLHAALDRQEKIDDRLTAVELQLLVIRESLGGLLRALVPETEEGEV